MVNRALVDEIIALGSVRLQKIFGLFDHVLVMEVFSKDKRRLYVVFDVNRSTKTFHLQREIPEGPKAKSAFTALLTKYGVSKHLRFFKLDDDGTIIKAVFSHHDDECALIFECDTNFRLGLFVGQTLCASFPKEESVAFRAGFLVSTSTARGLDANLARAMVHKRILASFHHDAMFALARATLKHELNKKMTLKKNVEGDRARCELSLARESEADLVKANMHLLKRGMKNATLVDYTINPPALTTIQLEPQLTPQEFLTKLYNKIKKAKRGKEIIAQRLDDIQRDIIALEERLVSLEHDESAPSSMQDMDARLPERSSKGGGALRLPFHVFTSSDDITLWVGKSAKDSDAMLRLVKGNEWFFHVRDAKGAHVIVKWRDELPMQTLHEAALLAHHFSKNRDSHSSVVSYTRAKNVQKKKGLAAGMVLITQEKTIEIIAQEAKLTSLLHRKATAKHGH